MKELQPADAGEARAIIQWAEGTGTKLEIAAGRSKRAFGRPVDAGHVLDVSRLSGILAYEPEELVLTARAATPLAEIEDALASRRQMLAFEPPDWRGLLSSEGGAPTLGGTIACALAGPRRVRAGSARDYVLGFSAINGRGEAWKAGGKVVKNVTGYDMSKLQTGAFGTLSLLTEITLKVMPAPEDAETLLFHDLADEAAIAFLAQALNTPFEVSGVAHLPAAAARRSGVAEVAGGLGAVTALRLEGPAPSVAFRAEALEKLFGPATRLGPEGTARFWREMGAVAPLLPPEGRLVWRLCPTPSAGPAVAAAARARFPSAEVIYDWGGGLVWLSLDPGEAGPDAGGAAIRAALKEAGARAGRGTPGHATLIVAPEAVRAEAEVFEPEAPALGALSARIRQGLDPAGILNPGRMETPMGRQEAGA